MTRSKVVLVTSTHAGSARKGLRDMPAALKRTGLTVVETVPIENVDHVRHWLDDEPENPPLFVAAGGDGTVGAVANVVANSQATMGILPLGTSNDVARSLDIPLRLDKAVELLAHGPVCSVDVGRFDDAQGSKYFIHAAALGVDVAFAKVATRASIRKRLGRLSYMAAATLAIGHREVFACRLELDGKTIPLSLIHLSVMNAPVFGGFFGLRLAGSAVDDRKLDVLAVENMPLYRLGIAGLLLLLRQQPHMGGVHIYHVRQLHVHVEHPVDVSLDGEVMGNVPGDFLMAGEGLRVVTGPNFVDIDDAGIPDA